MKQLILAFVILVFSATAQANEWIFQLSTFTHRDGSRVTQYTKPKLHYLQHDPNFRRWLYIHRDSNGNYYMRETWSYWPRPYSPYSRHYNGDYYGLGKR